MEIVPDYVGLDYHSDTIRVCVMDADGETMINQNVANDPGAVRDLVEELHRDLSVGFLKPVIGYEDLTEGPNRQQQSTAI